MSVNPYPMVVPQNEVSFGRKIGVRILGDLFLTVDYSQCFKKPMKIYLAWCGSHRLYFLDYMHGRGRLNCPECLAKRLEMYKIKSIRLASAKPLHV